MFISGLEGNSSEKKKETILAGTRKISTKKNDTYTLIIYKEKL